MSIENPWHELNQKEREAHEVLPELFSRSEYAEGKEKLNFQYQFSTGEVLSASEDERGLAHIVIKRGDELLIDFQNYLPNFKFVTPSYILKEFSRVPRKPDGEFSSEPFRINIGDMRDPRSILLLLHEIGHGVNSSTKKEYGYDDQRIRKRFAEATGQFKTKLQNERRELAEAVSDSERNAWAACLKLARQIEGEQGVNILEGFENIDELQQFISATLVNYREGIGESMISSDEGLWRNIAAKIKEKLWGTHERGAEQWKSMKKMFDKDRLKRKSIAEVKSGWADDEEKKSPDSR